MKGLRRLADGVGQELEEQQRKAVQSLGVLTVLAHKKTHPPGTLP